MEDNINEIEKIKGYTALQFIKGHEATIEVFKRLKECVQMNITQHSQLSKFNFRSAGDYYFDPLKNYPTD